MRLTAILLLSLIPVLGNARGVLRVTIRGLEPGIGRIYIQLIANARDFESRNGAVLRSEIHPVPAADTAIISFHGVPVGTYAVKVFQDLSGNGKLDKDFLGIPKEPFGFSNDAMGRTGPPTFAAASFRYTGGEQTALITLKRL